MREADIEVWARHASADAMDAVGQIAMLARADWLDRIRAPSEVQDVAPHCPAGLVWPAAAAKAAAHAAGEMAILCLVWPGRVDHAAG
jgi:hypothetical protein